MLVIGNELAESIRKRIASAVNAADQPAKPLTERYAKSKTKRGIEPVRNWTWSNYGTIYQMQLQQVSQNRGVIGFQTQHADMVAHFNNIRERAFAISPNDKEVLKSAVHEQVTEAIVASQKRETRDVTSQFL